MNMVPGCFARSNGQGLSSNRVQLILQDVQLWLLRSLCMWLLRLLLDRCHYLLYHVVESGFPTFQLLSQYIPKLSHLCRLLSLPISKGLADGGDDHYVVIAVIVVGIDKLLLLLFSRLSGAEKGLLRHLLGGDTRRQWVGLGQAWATTKLGAASAGTVLSSRSVLFGSRRPLVCPHLNALFGDQPINKKDANILL